MSPKSKDLNKYQKKSDREHILDNPDTYIGSVELLDSDEFIHNSESNAIFKKNIKFNPGLYKLFDEGIVNCRDHAIRMQQLIANKIKKSKPVTYIDISIDSDGVITMENDGNGIDIAEHPEYKIWIPEMIFGHLRTSTNYDKDEKKIVGGKNGFGFKLVLIWSTWGYVETVDHIRGLKYKQEFHNNLETIDKPTITEVDKTTLPYTKVSFKPDYKRMLLTKGITPDILALLRRRVYDIAAVTSKTIKVKLDGKEIPIKNFQQYVNCVVGDNEVKYEQANDRWEYAVSLSSQEGEFYQLSFVNGIYTSKGGKHVEYIMNQITRKLIVYIKSKKKIDVKASSIKEQLALFLRCDIENPSFDSQTKDFMNTPITKFGSSCEVSDKFIEKIAKMGIMNAACALTEVKENKQQKKTDGTKSKSIRGIPKLIDANLAGSNKSHTCSLILCEGDSAKAGIVSGLSREDRNIIGVYPMKGKMLNIRGESVGKIGENKEINEIKQILGLEHGKVYTEADVKSKLRYGKIIFMTDQDLDGSHIKGLGINLFDAGWKSLISMNDFIGFMNTPILKAEKSNVIKEFYNEGEFELWKKENNPTGWRIKYYKGLGTSTGKEFKEYFEKKKIVTFKCSGDKSFEAIDMAFNKKRSDDRKTWLSKYNRESYLDTSKEEITYEEFIDNEFIHFSIADNARSIPGIDGVKTSIRKILFAAFKKNLSHEKGKEIKVAQFSGYVSEHSGYHHGEASLNSSIIGLAQNFLGTNNINLFRPLGQFGTRRLGGKDAASERYIFIQLNKLTRMIFRPEDEPILDYLHDDGTPVEPRFYVPIIPMSLINGCKGIGTGFSTEILPYNPMQIIQKLKLMLEKKDSNINILPYYSKFKGDIHELTFSKCDTKKYLIKGVYKKVNSNTINITELPVGLWTEDYKEYIEGLIDNKKRDSKILIKDFQEVSTDKHIDFTIEFYPGVLDEMMSKFMDIAPNCSEKVNELEKYLKLYTTVSTSNMHLFDREDHLKKFINIEEIIDDYFRLRLEYYEKRKLYMVERLKSELVTISNKARYINMTLDDKIDLRRKKTDEINDLLSKLNFDIDQACVSNVKDTKNKYNYLTKMPMDSVSQDNVEKLNKELENKEKELRELNGKLIQTLWLEELLELETEYLKFMDEVKRNQNDETKDLSSSKKKPAKLVIKK